MHACLLTQHPATSPTITFMELCQLVGASCHHADCHLTPWATHKCCPQELPYTNFCGLGLLQDSLAQYPPSSSFLSNFRNYPLAIWKHLHGLNQNLEGGNSPLCGPTLTLTCEGCIVAFTDFIFTLLPTVVNRISLPIPGCTEMPQVPMTSHHPRFPMQSF